MKVSVELCFEDRGVRCVYRGEAGMPDVLSALQTLENHPEFDRISYVLHDCTDLERFVADEGEHLLRTVEELDSGFHGARARFAVITPDNAIQRSIEHCHELAHQNIEVFDSLYEAQIWAAASTGFADLSA